MSTTKKIELADGMLPTHLSLDYVNGWLVGICGCESLYSIVKSDESASDMLRVECDKIFDMLKFLTEIFCQETNIHKLENIVLEMEKIFTPFNFFLAVEKFFRDGDCSYRSIDSNFEMFFLILSVFCGNWFRKNMQNILYFDMPAGFGKTFALNKFVKMLSESVISCTICLPTVQAATLYTNAKARTMHSVFKIPIDFMDMRSEEYKLRMRESILNISGKLSDSVYIFDEFSMISGSILEAAVNAISSLDKFSIIIGDSCQFNPVCDKPINTSAISHVRTIKIEAKPDTHLARFKTCSELAIFVLNIRKLISMKKNSTHKLPRITPTPSALTFWLNQFKLFNIKLDQIKVEDVVADTIRVQQHNSLCASTHDYNGFIHPQNLITYTNKSAEKINTVVWSILGARFISENLTKAAYSVQDSNIPCFYFQKSMLTKYYDIIIKYLRSYRNIAVGTNKFIHGSFLKCKKNDSKQGCYNGATGILLSIESNYEGIVQTETIKDDDSFYLVGILDDDVLETFELNMQYYDFESRSAKKYRSVCEDFCEQCGLKSCKHKCGRVKFLAFYWYHIFSTTLHCLQGSTISEPIILITDDVLKMNILQSVYIILSRCKSPSQITVDINFVVKSLHKIFNWTSSTSVFSSKYSPYITKFLSSA